MKSVSFGDAARKWAARVPRSLAETLAQLAGVVVLLFGVGMFSVPIALILAGVLIVVAVERQ
jgi:hypothetical protein